MLPVFEQDFTGCFFYKTFKIRFFYKTFKIRKSWTNLRKSKCTIKPVKPGVRIFVLDVLVDMSVYPPHTGHQCQLSFHTTLPLPLAVQYLSRTEV